MIVADGAHDWIVGGSVFLLILGAGAVVTWLMLLVLRPPMSSATRRLAQRPRRRWVSADLEHGDMLDALDQKLFGRMFIPGLVMLVVGVLGLVFAAVT